MSVKHLCTVAAAIGSRFACSSVCFDNRSSIRRCGCGCECRAPRHCCRRRHPTVVGSALSASGCVCLVCRQRHCRCRGVHVGWSSVALLHLWRCHSTAVASTCILCLCRCRCRASTNAATDSRVACSSVFALTTAAASVGVGVGVSVEHLCTAAAADTRRSSDQPCLPPAAPSVL